MPPSLSLAATSPTERLDGVGNPAAHERQGPDGRRVRRTESGSGNMERFGVTFCWRRAIENGSLEVEDYSHLAMVSRFLAGEMGAPFMPTRSLLGSDLLPAAGGPGKAVVTENPWNPGERVALVPALQPEVSIVHVQRADPTGNIIIEGFATHEPEMIRASH